jgi:hypothetical protein
MTEHFTRNTVSATKHCNRCAKSTPHKVEDRRITWCIPCAERNERRIEERIAKAEYQRQKELFG